MYHLKGQKKCDGSDSKWCGKKRKGIQTKIGEWVIGKIANSKTRG